MSIDKIAYCKEDRTRRRIHVDEEVAFKSYNTQTKLEETESEGQRVPTGHKLPYARLRVKWRLSSLGLVYLSFATAYSTTVTSPERSINHLWIPSLLVSV